MKRLLFIFLLYWICSDINAQTPTQIINFPVTKYVFVGSLFMDNTSSANSQKIIVKIYGGGWFEDSNGETAYYISNREGLNVRQVSLGGSANSHLPIKAYQNGTNIDFYIVPNAAIYTSFAVSSFSYGYGLTPQYVTITEQTTTPEGNDITASASIKTVTSTDGNGNVGIGTTDPRGYKLAVNGKVRAQEIKVEASPWPDYVFAKDYELPTLQETEKHIKDKGHLPGIPSAAEVKANGVDLGEMNAKLLQKIEELTLHLIEMKKTSDLQNDKHTKEIEYLKSKIK
ncbi:hypothetical protein [Pedobacter africanus]|uniref:Uncharacterized protein n=1 Tax=Pedobacter africanus TaxID=151894 RepID=A0A1W2BRJ2_9SPHI|nr:hypothetical protein [Pedobacter africanus]SMC75222.1 hypothetical protein SAMN04488524_2561 [Pedobacter africanus]